MRANDTYNTPCDLDERGYWAAMTNRIEIREGDITEFEGDAIVNAANVSLSAGSGVSGAIFDAAGRGKLTKACQDIGGCEYGQAVLTPGFGLRAGNIIHTVGPIYGMHDGAEPDILRSCYRQALQIAHTNCFERIAFPIISAGYYGYPKDEAAAIALDAVREFYQDNPLTCIASVVIYGFTSDDVALLEDALADTNA